MKKSLFWGLNGGCRYKYDRPKYFSVSTYGSLSLDLDNDMQNKIAKEIKKIGYIPSETNKGIFRKDLVD